MQYAACNRPAAGERQPRERKVAAGGRDVEDPRELVGIDGDVLRESCRIDRECLGNFQVHSTKCDRLLGKRTVELDGIRTAAGC